MRRLIFIPIVVIALFVLMGSSSCGTDQQTQQREASIKDRAAAFARASRIAPLPKTNNFPLRKALVEFTERQDLIDHPWYVYILGMNGNAVAYYVARTVPINACDFLSSTQDIHDGSVVSAPSLDGIFYGGAGASSGCDSWFFFDSATNALIQIRGVNWYAADQPLRVEAEAIKVKK